MRQAYISGDFKADKLALIEQCNAILREYMQAGYRVTVRQLYYQLVARDIVENTLKSYKRVADIVNDGRLAGLIDWDAIEDRTREFIRRAHWSSGSEILQAVADQFHMDMWATQENRVFVVVEKEALAGVLERPCNELDVPLLAARGYPSSSVLREFSLSDLAPCLKRGQSAIILHLGDHDPSGIDMSRDLSERFCMFTTGRAGGAFDDDTFERIALNMPQIEELNPPPNPAKTTDSRFTAYMEQFGNESWELDALPPEYLDNLVRTKVEEYIDRVAWSAREDEIEDIKARMREVADGFDD